VRIPKDFKSRVLEVRILNELWVRFVEVRIVKGLADCGRRFGWIVVPAFGERQVFNTEDTKSTEFTETESSGDSLPDCWGEGLREDLRASCADKGVPACFSRLQKQDQYTGKRNEVKRIIVPSGYSNEVLFASGAKAQDLGSFGGTTEVVPSRGMVYEMSSNRKPMSSWGSGGGCGSRGSDCELRN
jgi:hypothetical protein